MVWTLALKNHTVAPPRGERGLKPQSYVRRLDDMIVAPPRGERGLKLVRLWDKLLRLNVAPPRGERGLKPGGVIINDGLTGSLPLVGSVD